MSRKKKIHWQNGHIYDDLWLSLVICAETYAHHVNKWRKDVRFDDKVAIFWEESLGLCLFCTQKKQKRSEGINKISVLCLGH
jgi:hypothetical protein